MPTAHRLNPITMGAKKRQPGKRSHGDQKASRIDR